MTRLFLSFLLVGAPLCFAANDSYLLLQKPALSKTQIVFVHAGDLWTVPREGGEAQRLTTGAGNETNPVFSPDGTQIAFTGEYDGNVDVFVMPARGGVPKRLTWHPSPDIALGWTPDGKRILFSSNRTASSRYSELFTVGVDGGMAERVPLPMGYEGSYSADGTQIAYVPIRRAFTAWKHYRGGGASPIWIANLASGHIEKLPRTNSNDFNPMWVGDQIYFLSDRNGPVSLFRYDSKSGKVSQMVENHGLDLKSASANGGAIVYEQFGALHLLDVKTGKTKPVEVQIASDMPEVREHLVNVSRRLTNAHISPTGARAVFEAHGEILTVPADKGDVRNLTNSPGVMDRDPAWSPDGKTIAYFSDESGEYQLHLRGQNGMGDTRKIALSERPVFYYAPLWSPDSTKVLYFDNHLNLWYIDVEQKKPVKVATDYYFSDPRDRPPSWSPDSKWIAYSQQLKSHLNAVYLYSLTDSKSTQITDGMSDAMYPVFDKEGKYLYLTSSTDDGASLEVDIQSSSKPATSSIYLVVLSAAETSPLAPESDEEKAAEKKEDAKPDGANPKSKLAVKVDLENIGQRILALPLPPRRYVRLQAGKAGTLYALESSPPDGTPQRTLTVHRFDLKKRKSDVAIAGVRAFEISDNGEKMLYRQGENWTIAAPRPMAGAGPSGPPPPASTEGALKTAGIEVRSMPAAEWKQMYNEVFRTEREFFYDPATHGLNLKAVADRYGPYLSRLSSRRDLNYLFEEAMGDLTVGHLFVNGGDMPDVKHVQTGLLGADYKIENGRYRIARVYNGENWNPSLKAPLTQPGVNVAAGDYLLAVNGRELHGSDDVDSFFEGAAGVAVSIKVGRDPAGANAREVTVVPVATEVGLRNLAWIEDNRRKVDQMSHGRVAYVYMPDTSRGGYTSFNRYFFAQVGKEAVVVDERFNGGGNLATDVIEYLKRPLLSAVSMRDGADSYQPQGAIYGPKAMIINEFAGSGGDAMPWYFRREGVGKLIGKRTWGGLVGIFGVPTLMDGGVVTSPNAGVWNPKGEWDVENRGVAPDIEVEMDPEQVRAGHDPQLEKAVQVVMAELAAHPIPVLKRPAFPNYHATDPAAK